MSNRALWLTWLVMTAALTVFFVHAITTPNAEGRRTLLPGETTHGHYQIELACNACHTEFMGVKQDACNDCHAEELKRSKDTHPAAKFNDPTNAARLEVIDVQKCITCHREHVPDRTGSMGLSIPSDYCYFCHEDVEDQRPSHAGMKHDSCQSAGCHNYHDNLALYEKFLDEHHGEPDVKPEGRVSIRNLRDRWLAEHSEAKPLQADESDGPIDLRLPDIVRQWAGDSHAAAGVNCRACHDQATEDERATVWKNQPSYEACRSCHQQETESFLVGRHGMRLAQGLSPMQPAMARLPMHHDAGHHTLDCNACHKPHEYDTKFAAIDACLQCHDDSHSRAYKSSSHYALWQREASGEAEFGTGVSCATCHLPRVEIDGDVTVQHNQNDNLRPNEKMIRSVCLKCHGLQYSLDSLANESLLESNFDAAPEKTVESVDMAQKWFEERRRKAAERKAKRDAKKKQAAKK